MPKRKSSSPLPFGDFEDDFEDETCSNDSKHNQPVQRNAANARERARMRVLSSAFCRLKTKLPWVPADTKLSKLDTLRLATIYIQQLRASVTTTGGTSTPTMSDSDCAAATNPVQSQRTASAPSVVTSMVWPFSFTQQPLQENRYAGACTNASLANTGLTHWLSATATTPARLGAAVTATNCSANDAHRSS